MSIKVKQLNAKIKKIQKVGKDTFLLKLYCPHIAKNALAGSFIHLRLKSFILRRPFSVHRIEGENVYILFKVRGKGTNQLAKLKTNQTLDVIGPLGNAFNLSKQTKKTVNILIAGGIGVAPLVLLAKTIKKAKLDKKTVKVLLGAQTKAEILSEADFKKIGVKVDLATDDGSKGIKGTVVDLLKKELKALSLDTKINIYACGPEVMFAAIHKVIKNNKKVSAQASFEQHMGCGLGFCCGCVIETKDGYKKVCKDGPVFDLKEVF